MGKNILWKDRGKVSEDIFAKHLFVCRKCGYEVVARHFPKEICPDCQRDMVERAAAIKELFRGYGDT